MNTNFFSETAKPFKDLNLAGIYQGVPEQSLCFFYVDQELRTATIACKDVIYPMEKCYNIFHKPDCTMFINKWIIYNWVSNTDSIFFAYR
jgi:hypothetical protein